MKIRELQDTPSGEEQTEEIGKLWKTNTNNDLSHNLFHHQNCKCIINSSSMPLTFTRVSKCCAENPLCLLNTIRNFSLQFMSKDSQEILIGLLLLIGLWTFVKWILNIVFSLMWPLFFITAILLSVPSWREYVTDEYISEDFMQSMTGKLQNCSLSCDTYI